MVIFSEELDNKETEFILYDEIRTTLWDLNLIKELIYNFDDYKNEEELQKYIQITKDSINLYRVSNNTKIENDEYDLIISEDAKFEVVLHVKPTKEEARENKYFGGTDYVIYL